MSRGRKWYKSEKYDVPLEPFDPGDGSLVECVPDPDAAHPDALKITRIWPNDLVTTVRRVPTSKYSHALILSVENDIEREEPTPKQKENMNYFKENIGTKHYRPPYTVTSIIPGQKPGETYDPGTGEHFKTRAHFSQYYAEHNLEQVGPADIKNMKLKQTEGRNHEEEALPHGAKITRKGFHDVTKPIPVPEEFAGVRWSSSS